MTDTSAPALGCPFHHPLVGPRRSKADVVARRVLRVPDGPRELAGRSAVGAFRRSMVISTVRCSLTYLVFPFALPALGLVTGVGVGIGIVIGVLAITCDVFAIRRFFLVDHRWRWQFSAIAMSVVCLLAVLLVQDVVAVAT